jgi:hypothetical protein
MNLTNTQFVFDGKTKRNLLIGWHGFGPNCAFVWSAMNDDAVPHPFWTNLAPQLRVFHGHRLYGHVFPVGPDHGICRLEHGGRRVWEAMSQFMWVGLSSWRDGNWRLGAPAPSLPLEHPLNITDPQCPYDRIIAGKAGFLNPVFYTLGTMGFLGIWYFWATNFVRLQSNRTPRKTALLITTKSSANGRLLSCLWAAF